MSDELLIRAARAVDAARTASEYGQSCDQGHDVPGTAARYEWDAASLLRDVSDRFHTLAEEFTFAAKRHDKAQREEDRTGVEYRGGSAA